MIEPQKLKYVKRDFPKPSVLINFPEHTKCVQLPVDEVSISNFSSTIIQNLISK